MPQIIPCPRLTVDRSGSFFTDILGHRHDLQLETTLRPKQAAADKRLGGMSVAEVRARIRAKDIYPVLRLNCRVYWIFDCGLTDWRARAVRSMRNPAAA